jgi:type II secretory pathway component PulK
MKRGREGFVLLVVLWVLVILTIITVGFGRRSMLDQQIAAYSLDHARALMMARGAVHRGIVVLRNKAIQDMAVSRMAQLEGERQRPPVTHLGQEWAHPVNLFKDETFFDTGMLGEGDTCIYLIQDEYARININNAPREILEEVEALDAGAVREIEERRRGRLKGREDEGALFYHAIEELRYIREVRDDDWYGKDDTPGLRDLLTIHGGGQININTAPPEVLACIPGLEKKTVNRILDYRAGKDGKLGTGDDQGFWDPFHMAEVTGIEGAEAMALRQFGTFDSGMFTVTGVTTLRRGRVRAAVSATVVVGGGQAQIIAWREEPLGT